MAAVRKSSFALALGCSAIVLLVFSPAFRFPFLNWDDEELFVRNTAWHAPHFVRWAFTTTFMQHVQPLAWMTWRAVDFAFGLTPPAAHTLNVVLHAVSAAMVFVLARRVYDSEAHDWTAVVAALLFAVH